MMDNASLEDSVIVGDRLAQITAAFEALQRNAATRRRALEHGLAQASEEKKLRTIQGLELVSFPGHSHSKLATPTFYLTSIEKNFFVAVK